MKKGDSIAYVSFVHANSLAVHHFVLRSRDDPAVLLHPASAMKLNRLVDGGRDTLYSRALHQWLELDDSSNSVPCRPSLVRDHYGVHKLLRPSILDLKSLLVLESLLSKAAEDVNRVDRVDLLLRETESESWANDGCSEFVRNGGTAKRSGGNRARKGSTDLQLEGEQVATCFEGVRMRLVSLKE